MSDERLCVAVLSGRDLVRFGLVGMLAALPQGVRLTSRLDPASPADVVIVDATGTPDEEAENLQTLTSAVGAPVIVLTSRPAGAGFDDWTVPVFGYLTVSATRAEAVALVMRALRAARRNRLERQIASTPIAASSGLSPREVAVLTLIASGVSNQQVCEELFLGLNTVKTYIRSTYRKIGVVSRSQAVAWALEHGLGPDGIGRGIDDEDRSWLDPETDDSQARDVARGS